MIGSETLDSPDGGILAEDAVDVQSDAVGTTCVSKELDRQRNAAMPQHLAESLRLSVAYWEIFRRLCLMAAPRHSLGLELMKAACR